MSWAVWRWVWRGVAAYVVGVVGWWFARSNVATNENETIANVLGFLALALGLLCVGVYFARKSGSKHEPPDPPAGNET